MYSTVETCRSYQYVGQQGMTVVPMFRHKTRLEPVEQHAHSTREHGLEVAQLSPRVSPRFYVSLRLLSLPVLVVLAPMSGVRNPLRTENKPCGNMVLADSLDGQVFCVGCSNSGFTGEFGGGCAQRDGGIGGVEDQEQ